ncbi:MAG: hypothetical protein HY292_01325 [Planctomycetes bacterium]|nr:hypothetical protein [Planctomycetota bacterium]
MADEVVRRLHVNASKYSVTVNAAVAEESNGKHLHPLAAGALYRLGAETVGFHESVRVLCEEGRAAYSAPLLRTLLDLLLSTLIVVEKPEEADLRGFRYTYFFLKAMHSRHADDAKNRENCCRQIENGIAHLGAADQARARQFMLKDRLPAYWYAPDFYHRPHEAAEKLLVPEQVAYYSTLSGAAHGGSFGLGFFRDEPDVIGPNPRDDPRGEAFALCTSIRIALEQARARDHFELGGRFDGVYTDLVEQLSRTRPLLEK